MSKHGYSKKSKKLEKAAEKGWHHGLKSVDRHEIGMLQEKLRRDHTDVVTRCTILGFYCSTKHDGKPHLWCENFEWLIKNCPDEKLMASTSICRIPESVSSEQFDELQAEFLQRVDRNRKNANVVGNAGFFIYQRNKKLAIELFKKARKLAPENSLWSQLLLLGYWQLAKESNDQEIALKTFKIADKLIKDLKKGANDKMVGWLAGRMCAFALRFNDLQRAKKYVKAIKNSQYDRKHPSVRHHLIGQLAIKENQLERAKEQLLKAAHKEDDLTDLQLANQLIERGELHTVRAYLEQCLSDDKNKHLSDLVDDWIEKLQQGKKIKIK